MESKIRSAIQSLIFAVLYLTLFIILMPALVKLLDIPAGKILYLSLVLGALLVAVRLRYLAGRLSEKASIDKSPQRPL